ncbi:MAG: SHOCT domain-containing protein [Desulfuromonadaceae bacterium]
MKKTFFLVLLFPILSACTSSLAVVATGNEGEYLSIGRNMASVFSSLELAQKEAIRNATEFCDKMGLTYKKKYAIDRPMAIGQAPESSLYFTCIDPKNPGNHVVESGPIKPGISEEIQKLFVLKEKGVLTDSEFQTAKRKLLGL